MIELTLYVDLVIGFDSDDIHKFLRAGLVCLKTAKLTTISVQVTRIDAEG